MQIKLKGAIEGRDRKVLAVKILDDFINEFPDRELGQLNSVIYRVKEAGGVELVVCAYKTKTAYVAYVSQRGTKEAAG